MRQIIHIGANKTASTLLQRRLFADHPSISYLGEDCADYGRISPEIEALVQKDASRFDETQARELFSKAAAKGTAVMVFSSEGILTAPHPSVCAERLGRLMPGATVVIVLRNQLTTWPSWYINHGAYLKQVPRRYWRRHVGFSEWLDHCFSFPDQTPVEAMNYWRHVEIFSRVFGADRMRILLYEDLVLRPATYFAQWAEILGLPDADIATRLQGQRERPRHSVRRFRFDRWQSVSPVPLGPLARWLEPWLDRGTPARVDLPPAWVHRITDYYAPGNTTLAAAHQLSLEPHGYPLSTTSARS